MEIIPLKTQDKIRQAYPLSPEVTTQIDATLQMSPATLVSYASIVDYNSPLYIKDETLVCLFREYYLADKEELVTQITQILMGRIKKIAFKYLPKMSEVDLDQVFQDIIGDLFAKILDFEGNSGNYYQIRFQDGVHKLVIGAYRKWEKLQVIKPLSSYIKEGETEEETEERLDNLVEIGSKTSLSIERQVIFKEGLEQLPEPYKKAFILRYYDDWPIESLDPQVITISSLLGKTPRTIRNWLKLTEEILSKWRGEKNERAE